MSKHLRILPLLGSLAASFSLAAGAASADAGISLSAGPSFVLNSDSQGPLPRTQADFGLGVDFGPKTIVPVRVSLDLDYAGGSSGGGSLNDYGVGLGARLTTPLYAGLVLSAYDVNVKPGATTQGGARFAPPSSSATGFGTSFFVGEKLFGLPGGAGVALQGTYRKLPSAGGFNPSTITVGLRANL